MAAVAARRREPVIGPVLRTLRPIIYLAAFLWRRLLLRTTFIGVTGSLGKTTAKECLGTILASRYPTYRTRLNQNAPLGVALNILHVRPWHRFAVIEAATGQPGMMRSSARMLRPDVVLVLNLKRTHTTAFRDLEEHASEKALLVQAVRPAGLAVLNADDPRVASLADGKKLRVTTFGMNEGCGVVGEGRRTWPERPAEVRSGRDAAGRTRSSAYIEPTQRWRRATAHALGFRMADAVGALHAVEPFPGRCQPARVPSGAIFLRDDYNSSIDSIGPSLSVLRDTEAKRRVLVMTDVSDLGVNRRVRLRRLVPEISASADSAVIIGEAAEFGSAPGGGSGSGEALRLTISSRRGIPTFELRDGDLVLLKGAPPITRTGFFAQLGEVVLGYGKPFYRPLPGSRHSPAASGPLVIRRSRRARLRCHGALQQTHDV
jgi:UDP-N-acetylmuramoyl-tripeptide--D-alanyl-D-alanine ligase